MEELINTGDTVIDIGANAGTFSIIAAALTGSTGKVLCFEPSPKFAKIIEHNIAVNNFSSFVSVHQVAVGSSTEPVYLNESVADDTTNYVSAEGTPVPQATLDSFTEDLKRINLIKIDAEGSELEILKGAEQTLKKTEKILFEICNKTLIRNGVNMTELYELLSSHFTLYYKHDKVPFLFDPEEDYNTDLIGYTKNI